MKLSVTHLGRFCSWSYGRRRTTWSSWGCLGILGSLQPGNKSRAFKVGRLVDDKMKSYFLRFFDSSRSFRPNSPKPQQARQLKIAAPLLPFWESCSKPRLVLMPPMMGEENEYPPIDVRLAKLSSAKSLSFPDYLHEHV